MTEEDRRDARDRHAKRLTRNVQLVLFIVFGVPLLLFVIYANVIAPALDDEPRWVTCGEVSSAAVETYKTTTRVDVRTELCGMVEYEEGVERGNAEEIAEQFRPGMEIEFLMGSLARKELRGETIYAPGPSAFREAVRE